MLNIGIDLGGTGIKAGLVDEKGSILYKLSCPTLVERGHEAVIHDMAQLALRVVSESGHDLSEVSSVGIGIPGIMDQATGIVPFCTNLAWHNVPLVKLMRQEIDKPIFVNNDATVAGLAESVAGVSAGTRSSVFVTLGTGVGGGVILDGKEYDRLGLTENYTEILGVKIPSLLLPIHPGRNLAVVLEVAARNFRQKQMGYNAAIELARRSAEIAQRDMAEDDDFNEEPE